VNPLIRRWFGASSHKGVKFLLRRNIETGFLDKKNILLAKFWFPITLPGRAGFVRIQQGGPNGLEDT
jgi:hypothetical protein